MPEHFKKYVNRKINPSYCTDYDKTYISIAILVNNAFKTVRQSAKDKEDICRRADARQRYLTQDFTLWWAGLRCIILEDCYSYKSPHHPKINFRLEKLSWELEFLFVNKTLIKLFCFIHKISCRCFILSSYAIKIICPISFPSGYITISIVLYLIKNRSPFRAKEKVQAIFLWLTPYFAFIHF